MRVGDEWKFAHMHEGTDMWPEIDEGAEGLQEHDVSFAARLQWPEEGFSRDAGRC
jgi:hypothetical protein